MKRFIAVLFVCIFMLGAFAAAEETKSSDEITLLFNEKNYVPYVYDEKFAEKLIKDTSGAASGYSYQMIDFENGITLTISGKFHFNSEQACSADFTSLQRMFADCNSVWLSGQAQIDAVMMVSSGEILLPREDGRVDMTPYTKKKDQKGFILFASVGGEETGRYYAVAAQNAKHALQIEEAIKTIDAVAVVSNTVEKSVE